MSGGTTIRVQSMIPAGSGPHPAVMFLHGSAGSIERWLESFGPPLVEAGIAVYAPHYFDRTGTERATREIILDGEHFPQWLATGRDCLDWMGAQPGVNANRIGVLGRSLGGFLALALATETSAVRAVVDLAAGMPADWADRVTNAMAPVLILHGTEDTTVPPSEAHKLAALLHERGVRHQMELLPGETHWFTDEAMVRITGSTTSFLKRQLLPD